MKFLLIAVLVLAVLAFYIRRTPVVPMTLTETFVGDTDLTGGFVAVRPFDGESTDLADRIKAVALATPRTEQLNQMPMTFVTRSRLAGFPDVTQVLIEGQTLTIHAHLVYGRSDLGVNKARVLGWLDRLGPLTQADGSANS